MDVPPLEAHLTLSPVFVLRQSLVSQTLVLDPVSREPVARRFLFHVDIPSSPSSVAFATGPFGAAAAQYRSPDSELQHRHRPALSLALDLPELGLAKGSAGLAQLSSPQEEPTLVTHLSSSECAAAVAHTTRPLYLPFDEFERYLGSPFPLQQLHFAFVPADAMSQDVQVGPGIVLVSEIVPVDLWVGMWTVMVSRIVPVDVWVGLDSRASLVCVPSVECARDIQIQDPDDPNSLLHMHTQVSEDVLCEEGEVEAAMEARIALASALARQWFGVLLVPKAPQVRPPACLLVGHCLSPLPCLGFGLRFGFAKVLAGY